MTSTRAKTSPLLAAALRRPELATAIDRYATAFDKIDARRIAIALDNGIDWLAADLAALATGRVVVPLAPFFSAGQVRHAIDSSGVDTVLVQRGPAFTSPAAFDRFEAVEPSEPAHRIDWLQREPENAPELPAGTFKISYTSGTTGNPKGACLSASLLETVATSLVARTRALNIERHLSLLPLAVLLENVAGSWAGLLSQAELRSPPLAETGLRGSSALDAEQLVRCLNEHRPQSIIVLPELLKSLCRMAAAELFDPSSLKLVAVGGARTPGALLSRARALGLPAYEGYGLTECGSVVCLNAPGLERLGSVGRPLQHAEVRVASTGELRITGAQHLGYVGTPSGQVPVELPTGDFGQIDADGYVHVAGRTDNRYSTAWGRNISPEWVEAELTGQPEIAQCFVHGRDLPGNLAIVVPAVPERIAAAIDRCNESLPDYARITRWLLRRERFGPHDGTATANGRLRRENILERHRRDIEQTMPTEQGKTA